MFNKLLVLLVHEAVHSEHTADQMGCFLACTINYRIATRDVCCNYACTLLHLQVDSTIFILFLTYFMIPASLRVATLLSISLTVIHLVVGTAVAYGQPADILGRQVSMDKGK